MSCWRNGYKNAPIFPKKESYDAATYKNEVEFYMERLPGQIGEERKLQNDVYSKMSFVFLFQTHTPKPYISADGLLQRKKSGERCTNQITGAHQRAARDGAESRKLALSVKHGIFKGRIYQILIA